MDADGANLNGGNSGSECKRNQPFRVTQAASKQWRLFLLDTAADNERNLLAERKSAALTLTDRRSETYPCIYPGICRGLEVVLSQIQQSHPQGTGENYHHFCVMACYVNRKKNSASSSSLEKTTIIAQTNLNKPDPLTALMSSLSTVSVRKGDCCSCCHYQLFTSKTLEHRLCILAFFLFFICQSQLS